MLSVGIAVAANQILNRGMWSWPWTLIAVVLAGLGAWMTVQLTRQSAMRGSERDAGQLVSATSASRVLQIRDIRGSARLRWRHKSVPLKESSPPTVDPAAVGKADADDQPVGVETGQVVGESNVGGSIIQIRGVGGDLEIDEP